MQYDDGWLTLADKLERVAREAEALDRDEHDAEMALERLLEAGRYSVVKAICEKALAGLPT